MGPRRFGYVRLRRHLSGVGKHAAKPAAAAHRAQPASGAAAPVAAKLGKARQVGELPANWSNSERATPAAPAVDGTYWAVPQDEESSGEPTFAPGSVAAIFADRLHEGPRFGVKPTVMPKQGLL